MFTGIVNDLGEVAEVEVKAEGLRRLTILCGYDPDLIDIGASIACSGVCLTVVGRGRAVVGARAGGIPDIVEDGRNGLLVHPRDAAALAAAIERILTDHELAVRLGAGAAESAARWVSTPTEYADRVRALVDTALEP